MEIETKGFLKKTQLLIANLTDEIFKVPLRDNEFVYQDESEQKSIFGKFRTSRFCCNKKLHCSTVKEVFGK